MCGLVGAVSLLPIINREWLKVGRDAMEHRGPDGAGEWWSDDGQVGLAHRRLSIVDLSIAGHQPMRNDQRGLTIVFNGEIYNFLELRTQLEGHGYRFKSNSDTEVLIAAYQVWGEDCLSKLKGMFAFALYDERRQKIFLARDRAGEKPLFYFLADGSLYFASELKALMANPKLPRKLSHESLDCYLAMGFVPGERCILEGYSKLPAGNALCFDLGSGATKVWRYWQAPELANTFESGEQAESELLDEMEALLEKSVSQQLIADVPVGILLSGGVDSSLITAMAARSSNDIQTFTIGFPGHGASDETTHARLIASHFGTRHTELFAQPTTADLLPKLASQFDEPIVDSSMIPTFLVSQLVKEHCTVALGGDGGDELFGGYDHYNRLLWAQEHLGKIPQSIRKFLALGGTKLPVGFKGRNWLQSLSCDFKKELPLIASYFDAPNRKKLMRQHNNWALEAERIYNSRVPMTKDLLQRATRMDFQDYLAEDILVKVDRASMLNSLEIRAPFLDVDLLNFAYSKVPSNQKSTSLDKKILLKRLTDRVLPSNFDKQRKQGFSIPLTKWLMSGPFLNLFQEVLYDRSCMFDRRAVEDLFRGQEKGRNNGERLFALVLFELWRHEYSINKI